MQIVIDIPEEVYKKAQETHDVLCDSVWLGIKNGTPLPKRGKSDIDEDIQDVLDKIRAEIEEIIGEHNLDDYDFCSGLICARKIIDKYKAESEG